MSIAISNRIAELEKRMSSLEDAVNILLRSERQEPEAVIQLQNEIRAMKARMGKMREVA